MGSGAFHIPVLDTVFKMIEERIPFGRWITTIASLLLVFSIIVFCASYLVLAASSLLGHAPHMNVNWPAIIFAPVSIAFIAFIVMMERTWRVEQVKITKAKAQLEEDKIQREKDTLDALKRLAAAMEKSVPRP
jgi:predicted Co/Zn/Cd cation transporter (cation efflux family)